MWTYMQMTVDECIDAYTPLSNKVFEKSIGVTIKGKIRGRFDTAELEQAVKQILTNRGLSEDILLKDCPAPCKVYVHNHIHSPQLRLREEQADQRHRLPDDLPISPRRRPPARFDQNMACLPGYVGCHVLLRPPCHCALRRRIRRWSAGRQQHAPGPG